MPIEVVLEDAGTAYRLEVRNGVLVQRERAIDGVDQTITTSLAALSGFLAGQTAGMTVEGDARVLARLVAVLDAPNPEFAIVTP